MILVMYVIMYLIAASHNHLVCQEGPHLLQDSLQRHPHSRLLSGDWIPWSPSVTGTVPRLQKRSSRTCPSSFTCKINTKNILNNVQAANIDFYLLAIARTYRKIFRVSG